MMSRIKELRSLIREYNREYYENGYSPVSDFEYDKLFRELKILEAKYPQFKEDLSPTKIVGNDLKPGFKKVKHSKPMLSIDNTYSIHELKVWLKKCRSSIEDENVEFSAELKMDGVACAIIYKNGILTTAVTRGNGFEGDDITDNVRTISSVPQIIPSKLDIEVRGEIVMSYDNFRMLNERLTNEGKVAMQNPRNTVSGTVKLLDSSETKRRKLDFIAYYLVSENSEIKTHSDSLAFLGKLGFSVVEHDSELKNDHEVVKFVEDWEERKNNYKFPIDGAVIKVNYLYLQDRLGATSRSPRWVIAYKYKPETAITKVIAIDTQVGRTGVITPVARLESVRLSGTTVSSATLHNYDEIERLGVNIGDKVELEKSGEIIPKILKVIEKSENSESLLPPKKCPSCNSELIKLDNEVALRCLNSSCPDQIFASLTHFVSIDAMNIDGLGPSIIKQLLEKKYIKTPADIYKLTMEKLVLLDRMAEKSARNLIISIEKSKRNPLYRLINALGIRMVGVQTAKILSGAVRDILDLYTISEEMLTTLETVGPNVAQSIILYFSNSKNREIIDEMKVLGVNTSGILGEENSGIFSREVVVITGTLSNIGRSEAKEIVENLGGKTTSSVTKKTTILLVGKNPGSKVKKAEAFGIKIITEDEFFSMIQNTPL